tara:strand:- start:3493 stop:3618 length:126 start_codon:yes stop_codon:yes gene_type:complete
MPKRLSMGGLFKLLEKLYGNTQIGADSKIHTNEQVNVVLGK